MSVGEEGSIRDQERLESGLSSFQSGTIESGSKIYFRIGHHGRSDSDLVIERIRHLPPKHLKTNIVTAEKLSRYTDVVFALGEYGVIEEVYYETGDLMEEVLRQHGDGMAIETSKKILVLEVPKNVQKWTRLEPQDSVMRALLGRRLSNLAFRMIRDARLLQIISVMGGILYPLSIGITVLPRLRNFFRSIEDALYLVSSAVIVIWNLVSFGLSNYSMFKQTLTRFGFWYIQILAALASLGFANAFKFDLPRQTFINTTFIFVALFVGLVDSIHPSIRQRVVQLVVVLSGVLLLVVLFTITGYLFPENIASKNIYAGPIISWDVGSDHTTNIYGFLFGLDWSVSLELWLVHCVYHMWYHPFQLVHCAPPIITKYYTMEELIQRRLWLLRQNKRRLSQIETATHKVCGYYSFHMDGEGNLFAKKVSKQAGIQDFRRYTLDQFWTKLKTKAPVTIPVQVLRTDMIARKSAKIFLLETHGIVMDDLYIVKSEKTLGQALFGKKAFGKYFNFVQKVKWPNVASVYTGFGYPIGSAQIFSAEFREITGNFFKPSLMMTAVIGFLLFLQYASMMNKPLVEALMGDFRTYFRIYVVVAGYWLLAYGTYSREDPSRAFFFMTVSFASMISCVFRDAIHPSARKRKSYKVHAIPPTVITVTIFMFALFSPSGLESPANMGLLLEINLGNGMAINLDVYAIVISKLFLLNLFMFRYLLLEFISPGQLQDIRSVVALRQFKESQEYDDHVQRVESNRASRNRDAAHKLDSSKIAPSSDISTLVL